MDGGGEGERMRMAWKSVDEKRVDEKKCGCYYSRVSQPCVYDWLMLFFF